MPMLEVFHSGEEEPTRESKAAFAKDAVEICGEVLGTPPGRLRLMLTAVPPEDTIEGLLEDETG